MIREHLQGIQWVLYILIAWNLLLTMFVAGFYLAYMEHEYTLQNIEQTWSAS